MSDNKSLSPQIGQGLSDHSDSYFRSGILVSPRCLVMNDDGLYIDFFGLSGIEDVAICGGDFSERESEEFMIREHEIHIAILLSFTGVERLHLLFHYRNALADLFIICVKKSPGIPVITGTLFILPAMRAEVITIECIEELQRCEDLSIGIKPDDIPTGVDMKRRMHRFDDVMTIFQPIAIVRLRKNLMLDAERIKRVDESRHYHLIRSIDSVSGYDNELAQSVNPNPPMRK